MQLKQVAALSPTEQRVYAQLYAKRVITTEDVRALLGDSHKAADYISNLRAKGYLLKVRKGVYAIAPPNLVGEQFAPDKYLVASRLKAPYYLGYHTALELHGLAQSSFNTVFIASKAQAKSFTYQGISYRFITTGFFFGLEKKAYGTETVWVSDREKTVLDCVRNLKYAGGLEELVKSLSNLPALNYKRLLEYVKRFGESSLCQKLGFILEQLDLNTPAWFIQAIRRSMSRRVYYLDEGRKSSLVRRWSLMVPKAFGEMVKGA